MKYKGNCHICGLRIKVEIVDWDGVRENEDGFRIVYGSMSPMHYDGPVSDTDITIKNCNVCGAADVVLQVVREEEES